MKKIYLTLVVLMLTFLISIDTTHAVLVEQNLNFTVLDYISTSGSFSFHNLDTNLYEQMDQIYNDKVTLSNDDSFSVDRYKTTITKDSIAYNAYISKRYNSSIDTTYYEIEVNFDGSPRYQIKVYDKDVNMNPDLASAIGGVLKTNQATISHIILDKEDLYLTVGNYTLSEMIEKDISQSPVVEISDVSHLPTTVDSNLGIVLFSVSNYQVIVTVWYDDINYKMTYNFATDTKMSIFNTTEAYFINVDNKPQIFINQSENLYLRDLLSSNNDEKPAFVPHVIWDLKTDRLTNVDKYNAHVFIKQNDKGALIAYYYVDEFIMDSILSTTLTYTSRKVYSNLFGWIKDRKPWETQHFSYTNQDTLIYKNQTSSWEQWIPIYNIIFLNNRLNQTFQMPRIEAVNFTKMQDYYNVSIEELNAEFSSKTPNFNSIKNNSRYKVFAFALQDGVSFDGSILGSVQTEFYNDPNVNDERNLKVIEIVYQTDEKIYTTIGNHMNLKITTQDKIDGVANDNDSDIDWVLIIILIFVGIIVLMFIASFINTPKVIYSSRPRNYSNNVTSIGLVLIILSIVVLLFIAFTKGWFL